MLGDNSLNEIDDHREEGGLGHEINAAEGGLGEELNDLGAFDNSRNNSYIGDTTY